MWRETGALPLWRETRTQPNHCKRFFVLLAITGAMECLSQQPTRATSPGAAQLVCIDDSAKHFIARGEFTDAEKQLGQSLPHQICPERHYLLAYVLMREGRAQESLAEYTAAARLRSPTAADLRSVALDYVLLKDDPDADHWAQRAVQLDAKDAESWYVLGRIRYSSGKFQDAADCFQLALANQPESVKAEDNLGLAYEGLNQTDQAIDAYRKAIAFGEASGQPNEQPLIDLAIVLEHRSDLDGARQLLARAVALAPEDERAHENLGHVYLERNELALAQSQLEEAVALLPADARSHYLLGQVYRREGVREKADAEFARFASLNGTHSTPEYVK